MFLFIDTIADPCIALLHRDGHIHDSIEWVWRGQEGNTIIQTIDMLTSRNDLILASIEGITIVNGPGPFTGMRAIVLTVNTISLVHSIPIATVDIFQLGELFGWTYPMIFRINREEYLSQTSSDTPAVVRSKSEITDGIYSGVGLLEDFPDRKICIQSKRDYNACIERYRFDGSLERARPLYVKPPNIT